MRSSVPRVSIILATHNRREVALRTLECIGECGLDRADYEVIVVDNASTDGAAEAIRPRVDLLLGLRGNRGSTAKAFGADRARGEYLVFLDDDSHPTPGSLERMTRHFEADATLGAAGFRVHLADGREEGGALPHVFVGCGVGLRASAYRQVCGLDRTFFMQAEEYDLAFRLASRGSRVEMFDDLHVIHEKTPHARRSERTTLFDTRNNIRVVARYVPAAYAGTLMEDCVQRYAWLANCCGHGAAFDRGKEHGMRSAAAQRRRFADYRLDERTFEGFFRFEEIEQRMAGLRSEGVRQVLLAGFGKNIHPFVRAADRCGVGIVAIADDLFAATGRRYRGIPVVGVEAALFLDRDAIVVSNTAPVHARVMRDRLLSTTNTPVHAWFANAPSAVPGRALRAVSREAGRQAGAPALSEHLGATAIS